MRKGVKISNKERFEKAQRACDFYLKQECNWVEACKSENISYTTLCNWAITNSKIKVLLDKTKWRVTEGKKINILEKATSALEKKLANQRQSEMHLEGFTDENGAFIIKKVVLKEKDIAPSDGIVQFVLKTLDPNNWLDKKDETETNQQPTIDLSALSDEQLGLLKKLKESMEPKKEV